MIGTRGDILKADAEALVNTVNCVMGRGIAAQFKRAYPKNFNASRQACTRHWAAVRPRIEQVFAALPDVTVLLFEPDGAPVPNDMVRSTNAPTMTPGRAVLVGLIECYLAGLRIPSSPS